MAYEKTEIFNGNPRLCVIYLEEQFKSEKYQVARSDLANGDYLLSITKGGFFKTLAGLKTAINVSFRPLPPTLKTFKVTVSIGLFETQGVPTAISMLLFWPLLITQVAGYVRNCALDRRILDEIRGYANGHR